MRNKALQTVQKYNMLQNNDTVLVGLSGGADSCALLYFLKSVQELYHLRIYACHINHGIRGAEADHDEQYVMDLCRKLNIEVFVLHADVPAESKRLKISAEQCGREIRYRFFGQKAAELHAKVATAHTASDNVETILLNLARGTGVTGLCGIPPVRENIIRPLIEVTREEIEQYCHENDICFVTDSTNLTHDYTRNKIRLDIVPVLKQINPSVESTITAMSDKMRNTADFLKSTAQKALDNAHTPYGYETEQLQKLDKVVFAEAVRILFKEYDMVPESKHIEMIQKIVYNRGTVQVKDNLYAVSKQGLFRIYRQNMSVNSPKIPFQGQSEIIIDNIKITFRELNLSEYNNTKKINKILFHNSLDCDTIPLTSFIRFRESGDRFSLPKRKVTKPLRKLMNELHIPSETRDRLVLLADGNRVLWAEHIGVSEQCRVTFSTQHAVTITVEQLNGKD